MLDQPRASDPLAADWTVLVLLLAFGCITYAALAAPRKFGLLARSFFALRLGKQAQRDELDLRDRTMPVLFVAAVLVMGLFAYQVLVMAGALEEGVLVYLRCLGVTLAVLVLPLLVLGALELLTGTAAGSAEYGRTVLLFHIGIGLLLLPLTMLMAYPPEVDWRPWAWGGGALLIAASLLFRWVRAVVVGQGEGVPLRYILIYLCAAEVVPVLLVLQQVRHFFPELPHQL